MGALRYTEGVQLNAANFVLRKPAHDVGMQPNGKGESHPKTDRTSRHASPDERARGQLFTSGRGCAAAAGHGRSNTARQRGPECRWASRTLGREHHGRTADGQHGQGRGGLLFIHVVNHPDRGEMASRNVQFEIEAKMGTLISKDTNDRVSLPVLSEAVLVDNGRIAFGVI